MVDRDNRDDWRRERSLLALGQAVRGEDNTVPIGERANASWREDAAARHRAARFDREAKSSPRPAEADEPSRVRSSASASPTDDEWHKTDRHGATGQDDAGQAPDHQFALGSRAARQPPAGGDSDSQEWKPLINPAQVIGGIARSRALILSTTILGAVLGIAIALSTPKKYEATTELTIEPGDLKLSDRDLTQSVGQPDAALAVVETRIKMATSGKVLDEVVKELNLVNDPEFNGQGSGRLGVMSLLRSMLSRNDEPAGKGEVRRQALAVGNLAESLSVERTGKTFVISISATTQSGEKSALIANTTRDVFQREIGQYQSDMAERATSALTSKLDELRKGVEKAERNVEDFRATHDLVDAQGRLISDDQMLKLNEQLSVTRGRTLELNARAASARSLDVNSVLNGTLPEEINSNMMSELRSQYAALKQEADRAAIKFGPRHPELQALNAQLVGARERISAELQRIAASLQVDLKRSIQLEQDLSSRLAQAKVQSGDVNNNLVSLRELEREAAAKRSVYEQYLLRAKETSEQKDVNSANINTITPAQPPLEAKGPSRAVMALAGLFAGLFAGIGLGALRGIYASLRETVDARSRRGGTEGRPKPVEDRPYRAAPPPLQAPLAAPPPVAPAAPPPTTVARPAAAARPTSPVRTAAAVSPVAPLPATPAMPPAAPANDASRPGLLGALASSLRYFVRRDSEDMVAADSVPPESAWQAPNREARYTEPVAPAQQGFHPPPASSYAYPSNDARPDPYARPAPYEEPYAHTSPADQQDQIDEIRASLREFREAVRDLTESRTRRRYF
ncbi:succinoglycan biosynthesis protein exop [Mesorhizobium sp. CU2]|uniref:GumC family protein n=1 Tax=unclassified Mesorhizobium TaxID=325217 RepID=UPI00112D997B|nr:MULTISPECIES: GumC family protein [unclassified Mesorhizobium]TPN80516.1 succinoglycan biosynthesis protein exop [Mesorhizobium sp. CU3]TPO08955.1 succinoglycan biosynthesis protein exop [Mesorhizobium sp. CU2]